MEKGNWMIIFIVIRGTRNEKEKEKMEGGPRQEKYYLKPILDMLNLSPERVYMIISTYYTVMSVCKWNIHPHFLYSNGLVWFLVFDIWCWPVVGSWLILFPLRFPDKMR